MPLSVIDEPEPREPLSEDASEMSDMALMLSVRHATERAGVEFALLDFGVEVMRREDDSFVPDTLEEVDEGRRLSEGRVISSPTTAALPGQDGTVNVTVTATWDDVRLFGA